MDDNQLFVGASIVSSLENVVLGVKVFDCGKLVAEGKSINGEVCEITMPDDVKLWSPDSPFYMIWKLI